jgi:hypothetical protein
MIKHEAAINLIAGYLSDHRNIPPERDGWFSMSEVRQGIRSELGAKVRSVHVAAGTNALLGVVPPVIEDAWFRCDENKDPILNERFEYPDIPDRVRRFYRALGSAASYATTETEIVSLEQIRLAGA